MTHEGYADFEDSHPWYRVDGELPAAPEGPAPLVVLHGGPGATHDYLLPLAELSNQGRAVVLYDQLGNGNSTHFPERGADFWTVDLFVRELANLLDQLGIADRYHVLGQSWGGFLAQEHALTQPAGLRSLVLSNTAALAKIDEDPTVYHTMNGPSEFHVIDSVKDWSSTDRLGEIRVPTYVVSGEHDEATPALQVPIVEGNPGGRQRGRTDRDGRLLAPADVGPDAYRAAVEQWLRRHD
jgi:pimeloyl-ACP methyl ester carboxylesterase